MTDLTNHLTGQPRDPHLQAYLLKRLARRSPQTILGNEHAFVSMLAEFEPALAGAVLDVLAGSEAPSESVVRFLLAWLAAESRWVVQTRIIGVLTRSAPEARVLRTLLALLGATPHAKVKASILSGLGRTRMDLSLKMLKPYLVHTDPRVRASAVEALIGRDLTGAQEILQLLLNDDAPRVKAMAAIGLWRLGHPVLLELLADAERPEHRVALLFALGQTGPDAQSRRLLERALESTRPSERLMACRGLARVAQPEDVPALVTTAASATDRATRQALVASCVKVDARRTGDCLHAMLRSAEEQRDPRRLASLVAMVAATGLQPDVELLLHHAGSGDGRVQANALETLSDHAGLPPVRNALVGAQDSGVPRVRANVAPALWRMGIHSSMSGLKHMLTSSQARMRASACWALGRIGGLVAASYLQTALDDPDEGIRRLAFAGLEAA